MFAFHNHYILSGTSYAPTMLYEMETAPTPVGGFGLNSHTYNV